MKAEVKKGGLTVSHQVMTVVLLPVCTFLLSVCTYLISDIYSEYKVFRIDTEKFKMDQLHLENRQNKKIWFIENALETILTEGTLPKKIIMKNRNEDTEP